MKFSIVVIALLCIDAVFAAGCGGGSSSSPPATTNGGGSQATPSNLNGPNPTTLTLSAVTPSGLTATLTQSLSTIATTGEETYTLALTNNTNVPIPVETAYDSSGTPLTPVKFQIVENSNSAVIYTYDPLNATPKPAPDAETIDPGAANALTTTITLTGEMKTVDRYSATAVFAINGQETTLGPLVVTAE